MSLPLFWQEYQTSTDHVLPVGVSSSSTVGAPTINQPAVAVVPTGISSAANVGTPTVSDAGGTDHVLPVAVSSQTGVGNPTVSQGAVALSPVAVATATAFVGTPAVSQGPVQVSSVGIASQSVVGAPTVNQGAVSVSPTGIATLPATVGAPILLNTWQLVALGVSTQPPTVGSPAIDQPFIPPAEEIEEAVISIIKICNLALTRIGAQTIASLTEGSAAAVHCKLLYAPQRDALLRMVPWRFATERQALAALTEDPPPQWTYVYQLPSDFLAARYIEPPGGVPWSSDASGLTQSPIVSLPSIPTPKFEVWGRKLMTHQPDAALVYTARAEDPTQFDPLFVEALSYKLAAELVMPLQSDRDTRNLMMRDFQILMSSAMAANNRDAPARIDQAADWIAGRA